MYIHTYIPMSVTVVLFICSRICPLVYLYMCEQYSSHSHHVQIGMAAAESVSGLKLIEAGVPKEKLALIAIPIIPIQVFLPFVIRFVQHVCHVCDVHMYVCIVCVYILCLVLYGLERDKLGL